jgi:hypothetical protein
VISDLSLELNIGVRNLSQGESDMSKLQFKEAASKIKATVYFVVYSQQKYPEVRYYIQNIFLSVWLSTRNN